MGHRIRSVVASAVACVACMCAPDDGADSKSSTVTPDGAVGATAGSTSAGGTASGGVGGPTSGGSGGTAGGGTGGDAHTAGSGSSGSSGSSGGSAALAGEDGSGGSAARTDGSGGTTADASTEGGGDSGARACHVSAECAVGSRCVGTQQANLCVPLGDGCDENYRCPAGNRCSDGRCVPIETRRLGDPCDSTVLCEAGTYCGQEIDAGTDGILRTADDTLFGELRCRPTIPLGEPCGAPAYGLCGPDAYCGRDFAAGVDGFRGTEDDVLVGDVMCRSLLPVGALCYHLGGFCTPEAFCERPPLSSAYRCYVPQTALIGGDCSYLPCEEGSWCEENRCDRFSLVGESCASHYCLPGLACYFGINDDTCGPLPAAGEPCASSNGGYVFPGAPDCAPEAWCVNSQCVPKTAYGEPCPGTIPCAPGLLCLPAQVDGLCTPMADAG